MTKSIVVAALSAALVSAASAYGDQTVPCRPSAIPGAPAQDNATGIPHTLVIKRGTVEALDPVNRLLALQDANGKTMILYAGSDIPAFEQLRLGDQVTVRYLQPLVLAIAKDGVFGTRALESQRGLDPLAAPSLSVTAERMHARTQIFGKVARLDAADARVSVDANDGRTVELCAHSPDSLEEVRIGDRVLVTYVEATVISIQVD